MIEVELRGLLSIPAREKLLSYCRQRGTLLGEFHQIAIFADTWGKQLGNFYNPKVRIALQLSCNLQTKKRTLHLKVKNGHWANVGRQETLLNLRPDALKDAYQLLRTFGMTAGCPRFYHRLDYQLGNITLSLKDGGLAPDHWEAEISAKKSDEKKAHQKLLVFLKKLGLTPWTEAEYKAVVEKVYRENPPIKFEEIDVSPVWSKD